MKKKFLVLTFTLLLAVFILISGVFVYAARPVVIGVLSWSGAIAISHVMKYVLEERLNIPVDLKDLTPAAVWAGMDKGYVDVYPDMWWPNQDAGIKKYVKQRKTVEITVSYKDAPQGWFVPTWVARKYNIKTYKDLNKYTKIFDFTGDGIGDIWAGGFGWQSTEITKIQLRDLKVNLKPYVVEQWVFLTQLKEAMRKHKPIVFYYWAPEWVFSVYDMSEVKLPPYDPAKWKYVEKHPEKSRITCGWRPAIVYVGFSKKLKYKSPKAYKFYKQWYIPIDEVSFLIAEIEDVPGNPKKNPDKVAKKWVENHPGIVNNWIKGIK